MKSDNEKWLKKQCTSFLNSKLNDVVLFHKAGLIREAALKRGISGDQVSDMYKQINLRKKDESSFK
jgi:hypothetical protein